MILNVVFTVIEWMRVKPDKWIKMRNKHLVNLKRKWHSRAQEKECFGGLYDHSEIIRAYSPLK